MLCVCARRFFQRLMCVSPPGISLFIDPLKRDFMTRGRARTRFFYTPCFDLRKKGLGLQFLRITFLAVLRRQL
jgi:hypothetical protein